jgi:hypothetical protein
MFDNVCGGSNVILTIFQICNLGRRRIPDTLELVLTIIIILVPFAALAYGLFCRGGIESVPQPGEKIVYDENGKETKAVDEVWSEEKDIVWLLPIWQAEENEKEHSTVNEDLIDMAEAPRELITITSEFVTGRLTECQEKIDAICDAYSTSHLTLMTKVIACIASACAGWLFGGVSGHRLATVEHFC